MNGALIDGKSFDSGCTRDSNRVTGGSVIDYVLASPRIFPRLVSLRISSPGYSDHNALTLGWFGKDPKAHAIDRNKTKRQVCGGKPGKPSSGPKGWCFLDSLPEEKHNDFVAHLAAGPRLREIASVCEGDDFRQASAELSLRRLHDLIRDAWGACGLKVHIISGKSASGESSSFPNSIPIASRMDDECRSVRAAMHRARRRNNQLAYKEARRHFKALKDAKIKAWRQKWRASWDPLSSSSDPRAVWHFGGQAFRRTK